MTYLGEIFELREEHFALLAGMAGALEWCEEPYEGIPLFDIKRPYGNSGRVAIAADVAVQVGHDREYVADNEERIQEMLALHRETADALHIILTVRNATPGKYRRIFRNEWLRVEG